MSDINTTPLVDVMLVMLIIFIIAVPVALQTVEDLKIPIFESLESDNKVENLLITVVSTDDAGLTPGLTDSSYAGSSRNGECRVYINNITPVNAEELREQAFNKLDAIVQRAGGAEAIMADPDLIPQVHIRADRNVPWRCVAGTIFNVQAAGYPTVGFISNPVDPNG
ncbi:MAG: biopolymer transporter ExbD [Sphingomonadales bacterium 32-68-7]|nr:MAG: biopolymer transporter ExbD [Sphingomonadales bacterium 12-68-11]OYX08592.1 MAG: biopolymer transporter ExbD [Sphingomonadales bacterium 32-68-7]